MKKAEIEEKEIYGHMLNIPDTLLFYRGTLLHRLQSLSFLAAVASYLAVCRLSTGTLFARFGRYITRRTLFNFLFDCLGSTCTFEKHFNLL